MWIKELDGSYTNNVLFKDNSSHVFTSVIRNKGKSRKIFNLDDCTKKMIRKLIPILSEIYHLNDTSKIAHAFVKGKSPISNARQHIGFDVTISLDIVNFFENTTPSHVSKYIAPKYLDICFIEGSLPQGFPSSPAISNIAMIEFDRELKSQLIAYLNMNKGEIRNFKLTRYADDITISLSFYDLPSKDPDHPFGVGEAPSISGKANHCRKVIALTEYLLDKNRYKVNTKKTKIQFSQNGNRIITGVGVNNHGTHATRASKRRLRAALHQTNVDSALGLDDWIENCSTQSS